MNRDGFVNKKEFQWMTTNTILSQKKIDTMFKVFKYDNLNYEMLPKTHFKGCVAPAFISFGKQMEETPLQHLRCSSSHNSLKSVPPVTHPLTHSIHPVFCSEAHLPILIPSNLP